MKAKQRYNFFSKTDLHLRTPVDSLNSVLSVAQEHGFRSIVCPSYRLEELVELVEETEDKPKIAVQVDFPYGNSHPRDRIKLITTAKELGADEVEISCPYGLLLNKKIIAVSLDAKALNREAIRHGIHLRYILDHSMPGVTEYALERAVSILSDSGIKDVSISSGYWDQKSEDFSDKIIFARNVAAKIQGVVKGFYGGKDPSVMDLFPKAGLGIMGVDWINGPNIVHEHEYSVRKSSLEQDGDADNYD